MNAKPTLNEPAICPGIGLTGHCVGVHGSSGPASASKTSGSSGAEKQRGMHK